MTGTARSHPENGLVFLKLGGSLITDKLSPRTAREARVQAIAGEISAALAENPGLSLVLGHGSGSFGHFSAQKYRTREGVSTREGWRGFAEVWHDARTLNHLVMDLVRKAGLDAIAFPPSASVSAAGGRITGWDLAPLGSALEQGIIPVVFGDVAFDSILGGTILSTEDLFDYLARKLKPGRILLAGRDPGVWKDYPDCTALASRITPESYQSLQKGIRSSAAPDVTGGMSGKVEQMLALVQSLPEINVRIFSGEDPGNIRLALGGEDLGTLLCK